MINPNNGSIYHYLDSFIKYSNECIVQKKIDDANIQYAIVIVPAFSDIVSFSNA